MIKNNGFEIENDWTNKIEYIDKIYDEVVQVRLRFTPKSKRLYMVMIIEKYDMDKSLYNKLKKTYNKKYGSKKIREHWITWSKNNNMVGIIHNKEYSKTKTNYGSKKYLELYEKETEDKL